MCQGPSNPVHTIIAISELFQDFLKHASNDGFVESWCLEIRLRSSSGAVPNELPVDCMHHLIGLHSLNYFILKRLDERHHDLTMDCCSCGWEIAHIPEFQHSDVHRYTPGTVIRWSQGECHVLLAPTEWLGPLSQSESLELTNDPEELQKDDPVEVTMSEEATVLQGSREDESLSQPRSGVIQSTEQRLTTVQELKSQEESPIEKGKPSQPDQEKHPVRNNSEYFIKHQHFCEENTDCVSQAAHKFETVNEDDINETAEEEEEAHTLTWLRQKEGRDEGVSGDDAFATGASEDDENSRMLVINEDDNSQDTGPNGEGEDATGRQQSPSQQQPPLSFHHSVLPSSPPPPPSTTTENATGTGTSIRLGKSSPSKEPDDDDEEEDSQDDDDDDDDTSSVSSSSSSSSSSTSSSSSSSDDDDRINFKKRVEQAAQAAREAAASAAATTASFQEATLHSMDPSRRNGGFPINDQFNTLPSPRSLGRGPQEEPHDAASLATHRHPDDIQAAQGLAALGKGHEFKTMMMDTLEEHSDTVLERPLQKSQKPPKIYEKLLQHKNANVRRVGPKSGFQCGICFKIFGRMTKALEHQLSHTGEKPWECDSCEKKFAKYHSMQKHKRAKHTPAHLQEFKCYICEKNFGLQSSLRMHLASHATLKPFSCSTCGQTFALKFTRDAHEAKHTGNRPWGCNICVKTFITKYKLKAHMKAHTGELFCALCNRSFASQDVMTRHRRRHEARKENPSPDSGNQKEPTLKPTKNISSRGRRRPCSKSGIFSSSNTSEFRCQMCNKTFGKSTDLTHHLASCNAITYCPPSNLQSGMPSGPMMTEGSANQTLNIHPPPEQSGDHLQLHHQSLSSTTPLNACMLVEEKKLPQFTSCPSTSNVEENMEGLNRRSYMMNPLPAQNMTSVPPFQLQEMVIHTASNPGGVPEALPDYLSEVAFGTASGNTSTIIFQPANG